MVRSTRRGSAHTVGYGHKQRASASEQARSRNEPGPASQGRVSGSRQKPVIRIRVHYLAFRDGKPTLDELVEALEPKLVGFCLPRTEINETLGQIGTLSPRQVLERLSALAGRARRLFIRTRVATGRSGEAGELLLYLLTEWMLAAPQLIAKMSLKTNAQMPVHGSDGIHIRYDEVEQTLLLFWGE